MKKVKMLKGDVTMSTQKGFDEVMVLIDLAKYTLLELVKKMGKEEAASIFVTLPLPLKKGMDKSWSVKKWLDYIEKDQIASLKAMK